MTDPVLRVDSSADGLTVLTLDRPEKRNALNAELRRELVKALATLGADDSCRVVVLTGAGQTFCAGFDLHELREADDVAAVFAGAEAYHHAVHTFPKPIIAAIAGPAVAGGLDLALMCDIRIADRSATFGQPQVRAGIPASYELLRSIVTEPAARDLCLTGRIVDATEAERLGLIDRVVGHDPLDEARSVALTIAETPAPSETKQRIVAAQPALFDPTGTDDAR